MLAVCVCVCVSIAYCPSSPPQISIVQVPTQKERDRFVTSCESFLSLWKPEKRAEECAIALDSQFGVGNEFD